MAPRCAEVELAQGDDDGVGTWRFPDTDGGTHVRYLWEVETRKRPMQRLAPLLAPLFRLSQDWLMQEGANGLAEVLWQGHGQWACQDHMRTGRGASRAAPTAVPRQR